jgi:hypothetical protein
MSKTEFKLIKLDELELNSHFSITDEFDFSEADNDVEKMDKQNIPDESLIFNYFKHGIIFRPSPVVFMW